MGKEEKLRGGLLRVPGLPIPRQEFIDAPGGMILQAREDVGEPGVRVDVVELGGLCRLPNYAAWFGKSLSFACTGRWSSDRRSGSIRHSLASYSASRKASRRSLGWKRGRLRCSYGLSLARAASLSARWASR